VYDCRGNGWGEIVPTITGDHENRVTDYTAVCIGNGQMCNMAMKPVSNSLDCMHDQQALMVKQNRKYIVRRLTPTECARLQGFPDCWGHPDNIDDMSDADVEFWNGVKKTHAEIMGKSFKPMTREQAIRWVNGLHTDSSEYKMWGNGIALPCAEFVLSGIAEAMNDGK